MLQFLPGFVRSGLLLLWYFCIHGRLLIEAELGHQSVATSQVMRSQINALNYLISSIQQQQVGVRSGLGLEFHIVVKRQILVDELPDLWQPVQTSSSAALHLSSDNHFVLNFRIRTKCRHDEQQNC